MNYYKIFPMDTTNGIGIRVILWICGCTLKCKNCHNQELQSFSGGSLFTDETKQKLFKSLDKPYIDGITLTGGHPFEEQNLLYEKYRENVDEQNSYINEHLADFVVTVIKPEETIEDIYEKNPSLKTDYKIVICKDFSFSNQNIFKSDYTRTFYLFELKGN